VAVAGYSGDPIWVWALWRPCLVAAVFLAILLRFLVVFTMPPPAPSIVAPVVFTVLYCTMLARSAPHALDRDGRTHFGTGVDLAAVERWQYALNLHQLILGGWVVMALISEVRTLGMHLWGNAWDPSPRAYRLGWLIWVVYSNRYMQGLDTLFLLLRDKFVSVLHVFQQLALVWAWWLVCRLSCGGDAYFAALLQSAYNVITYGYFVYKRNKRPSLRAQFRITHVLMVMLAISGLHTLYVMWVGNMPRVLALVDMMVMLMMLLLFGNYRYHKYLKPFDRVLAERRAYLQTGVTGVSDASGAVGAVGVPQVTSEKHLSLRHVVSQEAIPGDQAGVGPKLVVSFDSSGWLYMYHFGVCRFMQLHVLRGMPADRFAFSGSSGGALAATSLACDVPIDDLVDEILRVCWPWCRKSPFAMCPAVDYALNKFLPDKGDREDAWSKCSGRLRLLVTRVRFTPPWFLGDVVSRFENQRQLRGFLRASCHMPIFGGVLPYSVEGRWYFDGLFWASFLVPWRRPTSRDHVLKVSAVGAPTAHLRPPNVPPWWTVMPPSTAVLRALYERGYQDALQAFRDTADGGGGWAARVNLAPAVRDAISRVHASTPAERRAVERTISDGVRIAWAQVLCGFALAALAVAFARFCAA